MPRPTTPIPALPWTVAAHANGYVPVVTVSFPHDEVLLVPVNGDMTAAEAIADRIVWWSEMEAAGLIP